MGSRWASWTGKHPHNPNPSQGPLVRSLGLGAGMLQWAAAWFCCGRAAAPRMSPWDWGALRLPGCCDCPAVPRVSRQMHHRKHLPWLACSMGCSRLTLPAAGSGDVGLGTTTLCASPAFRGASAQSLADIANTAHWGSTTGAAVSALQSWLQ